MPFAVGDGSAGLGTEGVVYREAPEVAIAPVDHVIDEDLLDASEVGHLLGEVGSSGEDGRDAGSVVERGDLTARLLDLLGEVCGNRVAGELDEVLRILADFGDLPLGRLGGHRREGARRDGRRGGRPGGRHLTAGQKREAQGKGDRARDAATWIHGRSPRKCRVDGALGSLHGKLTHATIPQEKRLETA
ncbi:hypothetical protein D3C87_1120470 [compost metagenome]